MNTEPDEKQKPVEKMTFEECYTELQNLVDQFERGTMPLAESVERFERGMQLLKRCNQQLNEAETRVENLLRKIEPVESHHTENEPFDADSRDSGDPL